MKCGALVDVSAHWGNRFSHKRWNGKVWEYGGLIADEDGVVRFEEGPVHLERAPSYVPEDLDVS